MRVYIYYVYKSGTNIVAAVLEIQREAELMFLRFVIEKVPNLGRVL